MTKVLGILPARGGSKGVFRKNVRPLLGKPLIAWAASALACSKRVSRAICSTDDEEIASAAVAAGLEVPWIRPSEIASDTTLVVDVLNHALERLAADGDEGYHYVALAQATSPTVTVEDIDEAIELAIRHDADTVITGYDAGQRHPTTMFSLSSDKRVNWLMDAEQRMARRQDLKPYFIRTGLVYVIKRETLVESRSIYGNRVFCMPVPEARALTIDDERDFELAEFILRKH
ncbi:cytidylyltransferase domain-containing protein [Rhizobium bangladeshense]|uniref:acylneuraminate cytidylyltransferase family protein n=1 Tax=Rhizobium bangladeshense TaxID=1138189 RepID=UPI0007E56C99|nr:acylneuraminate cytidylyltransferase family protein [Rhizobium bangladeshense]